jgi:hypothetical protein
MPGLSGPLVLQFGSRQLTESGAVPIDDRLYFQNIAHRDEPCCRNLLISGSERLGIPMDFLGFLQRQGIHKYYRVWVES